MIVEVLPSYEAVSDRAFHLVSAQIQSNPASVLGLATGSTPLGLYARLVDAKLNWSAITTFNLDEYVGLASHHPQSYHHYMCVNLFERTNISPRHTHFPQEAEGGTAYEASICRAGGIDLQVLGIGSNGHIGFNEPGSSFTSRTRQVALAASTIADNARFFEHEDEVPRAAITMGIGTIMEARSLLLMACGTGKAKAVAQALSSPATPNVPASAIQNHLATHVLLDQAAAKQLQRPFDTHT